MQVAVSVAGRMKAESHLIQGIEVAGGLINQVQKMSDTDVVTMLYMNVLSRLPSDDERQIAMTKLGTGERKTASEDLLWSLYNKVDFIFNY